MTEDSLPTLAIRPYPTQYVGTWTLKDGNEVTIRPIRPEDEPLIVRFHQTVSERIVYFRYFTWSASASVSRTTGSRATASSTMHAKWRSWPSGGTPPMNRPSSPSAV
jgi:hypothetical protein